MYDWSTPYLAINKPIIYFGLFLFFMTAIISLIICYTTMKNKMDTRRITTQIWMYLIIYCVIISPQLITALSLAALVYFILKESLEFNEKVELNIAPIQSKVLLLLLPLASFVGLYNHITFQVYVYFVFLIQAMIALALYEVSKMGQVILFITITCLLTLSLNSLLYLRGLPHGAELCLFIVYLTNISDTFAFFGGKLWGKNKLCNEISPGKTIEGSIIAVFLTLFFGFLLSGLLELKFTWWNITVITLAISISGQMGDILASVAKRAAKIKDFSTRLPGHGGFLDRCDSLILTLPTTICLLLLMNLTGK